MIYVLGGGGGSRYPQFTYTGLYAYSPDGDSWKLKLLTSGTLNFSKIGSAEVVDVFLVGGGGGGSGGKTNSFYGAGGGGGYTNSVSAVRLLANNNYPIVIGAGGAGGPSQVTVTQGGDGGTTSAFNNSANGGKGGYANTGNTIVGGNGGSGGSTWGGTAGTDGGNGSAGATSGRTGGTGQGTSTRAFYGIDHDSSAELYSNGGAEYETGSYVARENMGDGGRGGDANSSAIFAGSSGVVIIRPHVEVY